MTLQLMEGFDHFSSTANAALKGWNISTINGNASFGTGRINGGCVQLNEASGGDVIDMHKFFPAPVNDVIVGVAVKVSQLPSSLFLISSGATRIIQVGVDGGGKVTIIDTALATVVTSVTATVFIGAWSYVEVKLHIAGSSGSVTTQANGGADIGSTTHNFGTAAVDNIRLTMAGQGSVAYDDIYVCDTAGSENNTFLGDRHVETLYASGAGAHTQFTPDTGSNYARVNEHNPDADSSYVADNTIGDIDSYVFDDLSVPTADIRGVQVNLWTRKLDGALRQVAPVIRQSSTDYIGATQTLASSYVDGTQIYENDPSTSADWTVSGVNSAQFGIKVVT